MIELRHIRHDEELVRPLISDDILHIKKSRYTQLRLCHLECQGAVPEKIYFCQGIMGEKKQVLNCKFPKCSLQPSVFQQNMEGIENRIKVPEIRDIIMGPNML